MGNSENEPAKIIYVPSFSELTGPATDEIDLREIWRCLMRGKWMILGTAAACTLTATLVVLLMLPVTYKSWAVLIPAQSPEDTASQMSGLVGQLGLPLSLPGSPKSNSIMAFLGSRSLQERLISKYELLPRLYPELWDAGRKTWRVTDTSAIPTVVKAIQKNALGDIYGLGQEKATDLITISWVDQDPAFSALMLTRIIQELQHYLDHEYEYDSQRQREFVEQQLAKATAELERWEQQVPSQALPLAKIMRERAATQTVYTELRRQLEMAKIDEAKDLVRFKVLDPPIVPEEKFKPHGGLIISLTLLISAGLAAFAVLGYHFLRRRPPAPVQ